MVWYKNSWKIYLRHSKSSIQQFPNFLIRWKCTSLHNQTARCIQALTHDGCASSPCYQTSREDQSGEQYVALLAAETVSKCLQVLVKTRIMGNKWFWTSGRLVLCLIPWTILCHSLHFERHCYFIKIFVGYLNKFTHKRISVMEFSVLKYVFEVHQMCATFSNSVVILRAELSRVRLVILD